MGTALSRRDLARMFGVGVAAAGLRPLSGAQPPRRSASDLVRLSANENPYGPSPAALVAMREATNLAWRYPDEARDAVIADLAKFHGMAAECFLLGDGSSEILKLAASAFTSPERSLVIAEPSFEAIAVYARARGAKVVPVPLDPLFAHDLEKMAVDGAGLVYVCNPNNPTGSITRKGDVRAFIHASRGSVLVDEAYHHYADSPEYESAVPLIASHPNLIVARTFSKIYGLAGVRLGYAIAQPEAIEKLVAQAAWDSVNVFALAAARASLRDAGWVPTGRKRNAVTRDRLVSALSRLGYAVIPSHTNFVMFDTRREVKPLIAALHDRGVDVGRFFPALPHHLRVTIGTPEQVKRFLDAFAAVTA
jgi:histidinol-phosphate aminotransferase